LKALSEAAEEADNSGLFLSPSGSQTNPYLGEVVVVSNAPAGDDDPFLGTVAES
jgi:hypothetical protein